MQRHYTVKKNVVISTDAILRTCKRCNKTYPMTTKHFKMRADGTGWLQQCVTCYGKMRTKQRAKIVQQRRGSS